MFYDKCCCAQKYFCALFGTSKHCVKKIPVLETTFSAKKYCFRCRYYKKYIDALFGIFKHCVEKRPVLETIFGAKKCCFRYTCWKKFVSISAENFVMPRAPLNIRHSFTLLVLISGQHH